MAEVMKWSFELLQGLAPRGNGEMRMLQPSQTVGVVGEVCFLISLFETTAFASNQWALRLLLDDDGGRAKWGGVGRGRTQRCNAG